MSKINIILVDDHQIVRDGIKALVANNSEIEIIGEAKDSDELFCLLKIQIPDIILLDIALPTLSGIEISKILKEDFPQIKILMLSMYTSEDFIFNALKSGVDGYLPKNTTQEELLLAIKTIIEGNEYFSKSISDTILKSYMNSAKQGNNSNEDILDQLTKREEEILFLVVDGMTNPHIAEKLFISTRTVEAHKASIMRKLNLNNTVDLVKFAIKNKIIEL